MNALKFRSTKTFGNDRGLSCCFRQWRAESHCRFIHGYSIGVHLEFEASELDERNWVYDFGATKWIKALLEEQFDHTILVAADDPEIDILSKLGQVGQLRFMQDVGCEAFARWIYQKVADRVSTETAGRVRLAEVKVFEHAANAAKVIA